MFLFMISSWVWAEAAIQPALEEALEIGGFGYPVSVLSKQIVIIIIVLYSCSAGFSFTCLFYNDKRINLQVQFRDMNNEFGYSILTVP